ncbi:MAG: hypothetical protein ACK4P4_12975 [Allorhizobium sp.]
MAKELATISQKRRGDILAAMAIKRPMGQCQLMGFGTPKTLRRSEHKLARSAQFSVATAHNLRIIAVMGTRDDFRQPVIRQIAQRAGYRCSNPSCLRPTIGPDGGSDTANIGVAAHISAAAEGGPRYEKDLTPEERSSAENGIWLCQTCSRLVDVDLPSHSTERLREWKTLAEMRAYLGLRGFSIVVSRSFEKLESMVPELVAEMRADIAGNPFTRELIAFDKNWSYGGQERPYFTYYHQDHVDLLGKLNVMKNYGALFDVKFNDIYRYEMTEDFVEYLQMPR